MCGSLVGDNWRVFAPSLSACKGILDFEVGQTVFERPKKIVLSQTV
jgi:hypothetical protein